MVIGLPRLLKLFCCRNKIVSIIEGENLTLVFKTVQTILPLKINDKKMKRTEK